MASHQDVIFTYHSSDMILACHSNVAYLSETKARIQAGEHLFLSYNNETPSNNGEVLKISLIIKVVINLDI